MSGPDTFGPRASAYAAFRPDYPQALIAFVASLAPARRLAWDCATGSGQAAAALAEHFEEVVATDLSDRQLEQARPHPRVRYRRAAAEKSGLPDSCADLVTVAQALHWFDLPRFYAEVTRVLVPGGALAVWTYGEPEFPDPRLTELVRRFDLETLDVWWQPGREHIRDGYRQLPFPFPEAKAPAFVLERRWTRGELVGYLRSWSAVATATEASGKDPVVAFEPELAAVWGSPERRQLVRWPLTVRAGNLPA
ncbi:MAG TPA: class I SAM-dependent methyltransferase [Candidatus Polarisedimenticolaceae bacterium]|nr:class I SAM-dependent methyltransferase [Candidatus Polarisedimenticolaceae bacterium]